jgi:hypothetical protein
MAWFRRREVNVWKGLAGGLAGGLVASLVMNQFQALWSKTEESLKKRQGEGDGGSGEAGKQPDHDGDQLEAAEGEQGQGEGGAHAQGNAQGQRQKHSQGQVDGQQQAEGRQAGEQDDDDATVKTAARVSSALFDHPLSEDEKKLAGPAVHYAFGTLVGGLYGAAAELAPSTTALRGMAFGAAVWLAADEVALPAFDLAKPPQEVPPEKHVYALASHLVYGLTADAVRRWIREVW